MADLKEHAHELIERMAPGQVEVVVNLLEIILDPTARSLAKAPVEDETIGDEENLAVTAAKNWLKSNQPIPNEDVLSEFGLSKDDFERMGHTPLGPHKSGQ